MTDPARNRLEEPVEPGGARRDRPLEDLRELILGPFRDQLDRLQQRADNPPKPSPGDVGRVLPEAIAWRSSRDKKLALALEPITATAIHASIRKNRRVLVEALFPVMGPAIRKAVATALQGMIQSLNQVLEYTLSLRSLKWRLEALRTGKPLAEVVLLHTMLYQVEQVFLIHRRTGIVLQHALATNAVSQDPDLISGMLTAIRDFVQDSFGAGKQDALNDLRVGDRSIWIEQGSHALLAAAIRGNPPPEVRTMLAEALDEIHLRKDAELEDFAGDTDPFGDTRPVLDSCLQVRIRFSERRRKSLGAWLAGAALVAAVGWGVFRLVDDRWRWSRFMSELRALPGVVVTEVESRSGRRHVYGLRDPYAPQPADMLGPAGIRPDSVDFHWEAFQSSHPEYARRRVEAVFSPPAPLRMTFADGLLKAEGAARGPWIADTRRLVNALPWISAYDETGLVDIDQRLQPPLGTQLMLVGEILHASGIAPNRWIADARAVALAIPGITEYRDGGLVSSERRELDQLKFKIESTVFRFARGRSDPGPGQEAALLELEQAALRLTALAGEMDQPFRITLLGHSDSSGTVDLNMKICADRAQTLRSRLAAAGVPEERLAIRIVGSSQPLLLGASEHDHALNRRVTFEVTLSDL
jgi:outer membrane protein OmpA-like peptidoglycan-associated protein